MSQKTKNIIIITVLVAVVFIAYSFFFKKDTDKSSLTSENAANAIGESSIVKEFLSLLNTLNDLKLDTRIFQDQIFNSLRDESVELISEPRGRQNPFAPLESKLESKPESKLQAKGR